MKLFTRLLFACLLVFLPLAANAQLLTTKVGPGGFGSVAVALLNAVNTTFPATTTDSGCWSGQWASGTPALNNPDGGTPTTIPVVRGGYSTSATLTTYNVNIVLTKRVNQNVPNYNTPTASTVAFSNYVYPTDTVPGGSTTSCDVAPPPVVNWATPERLTFGNTMTGVEIAAFSRDARLGSEVAAIVCTASDGTHSVSGTVSAMTVSARSDPNAVVTYLCPSLNLTSLNAGSITLDAAVYPWFGNASTVNNSANNGALGLAYFTTRHYWHDTTSPLVVYLCPQSNGSCTGVASTLCVASTTPSTAALTPCSTGQAASNALRAAGNSDNVIVYVGTNAGTPPVASNTTSALGLTQAGGCILFTRDPLVTRANAQLGFASVTFDAPNVHTVTNVTTGCVRFFDLTMVRTANTFFSGDTPRLEVMWDNITLNNGGFTANWLNHSDDYWYDVVETNSGSSELAAGANGQHRIFRGLTVDNPGNMASITYMGMAVTTTSTATLTAMQGATLDDQIVAFNKFFSVSGNLISWADTGDGSATIVLGTVLAQNVIEFTSATAQYAMGISNDFDFNSTQNVLLQNNTFAGAFAAGRWNSFYDWMGGARTNKLQDCRGNAIVQLNTKGQLEMNDATRAGNTGYEYGVGCQGQVSAYIDANSGGAGTSFAQVYPGLSSNISATNAPATNPFKFTTNAAVTYSGGAAGVGTYTAGAGGGNYVPLTSSPLKGVVLVGALPFDLAGTARPATADSAGAYVAP